MPGTNFSGALANLVMLAAELEGELGIDIDDDELIRMQTVGDLFKAIENSQRRNQPV